MQQVETGSRFWWRALDARSPEPVTPPPSSPPISYAPPFAPKPVAKPQATRQPANPYALQIPKADRRRRMPSRARHAPAVALMLSVLIMASGTAAALLRPDLIDRRAIEDKAAGYKTALLVAAGFGISQVSVTGHRYTLDRDVFDALDLPNVKTFADLDSAAALKRIERLPWVETAQITRVYPGTVSIEIRERLPYAQWNRGDRRFLIDATGRVLGPVAANQTWDLPLVAGEGASAEAPLLLTAIGRMGELSRNFSHAERITSRRWSVVMKNGSRIELGADRDHEGLAQVAGNSELRRALAGPPVVVDVRTPGRIAVRPLGPVGSAALIPVPQNQVAAAATGAP